MYWCNAGYGCTLVREFFQTHVLQGELPVPYSSFYHICMTDTALEPILKVEIRHVYVPCCTSRSLLIYILLSAKYYQTFFLEQLSEFA